MVIIYLIVLLGCNLIDKSYQVINPSLTRVERTDGYMKLINTQGILMIDFSLNLRGGDYQCIYMNSSAQYTSKNSCPTSIQAVFASNTLFHWSGDVQVRNFYS
jgi:hypothetical protein